MLSLNIIPQVDIFFGTMVVTEIEEQPENTSTGILNSLGGALSLWLGISMIMVFEIVELTLRLVYTTITQIIA